MFTYYVIKMLLQETSLKQVIIYFISCNEIGQTLLLHADLLNWGDEVLPEQGDFPTETSTQRKEKLIK